MLVFDHDEFCEDKDCECGTHYCFCLVRFFIENVELRHVLPDVDKAIALFRLFGRLDNVFELDKLASAQMKIDLAIREVQAGLN